MLEQNDIVSVSYNKVKLKTLFSQLKNIQKFLKNCYYKAVDGDDKTEIQKVIYDNYYIIDNKIKLMLKYDKSLFVVTDNILCTQIGDAVLNACEDDNLPDKERFYDVIAKIQNLRYISNTEFELLEWEFSYSVILKFAELAHDKNECRFSPIQLIALLSKSDILRGKDYVEVLNPIENIYKNDPAGIYTKMDTVSRQIYRERTSYIASKSEKEEKAIAEDILNKAQKAQNNNLPFDETHVGFYVYSEYQKVKKSIPEALYYRLLIIIPLIISFYLGYLTKNLWLFLLMYFPVWEITKTFIDYFSSLSGEMTYLPRLENEGKIPENCPSVAVISTVLTSPKDILKVRNKLKSLHFLSNTENLKICLLCDFVPAKTPKMPEDNVLSKAVQKVIDSLNNDLGNFFCAVIRNRTYSKTEEKFIGYERKRGAIEQLIGFIKDGNEENITITGDKEFLKTAKYIIALDYDTKPLMDTICDLVSIAEHPLNTAVVSNNKVVKGYGILAPKISTQLESSLNSPFSKLFGGVGSSCAYDVLCGNLYQDCFHEGIFAGKGLINIDAYYTLCYKKFPDDTILSHDILEGSILRTGFAGDIEFSDGFPATVMSYFKRLHRWIRGDIQNSPYIFKSTKLLNDTNKNPISSSNRFKLFDNVRRALTPVITYLLFFLSFFVSLKTAKILIIVAILSICVPFLWGIINSIRANGYYSVSRKYYSAALSQTKSLLSQLFYSFILLPQQAVISLDAIIRAVWRRFFSKKNLLEWTTAAQTDIKINSKWKDIMYYLPAEVLNLILLIFSPFPISRFIGLILSFMPLVILLSNKPYTKKRKKITTEKRATLFADVAAMWQFYEDYANRENNYLPPDNVQFSPIYRVCYRTSPTNIGMFLLSCLTARDFDLIDSKGLYTRINRSLSSIEKLQKYHGNLYNWYDTPTLELSPNPFISSVDSGNFLCCLVALKEGLKEYESEEQGITNLISRVEKIINDTDIKIFYNDVKNLFTIGIDPTNDVKSTHHYDMLMSEARMLSYFAIARRDVPKKHWRSLARTMKRKGNYSGSVSYSGTMFEFFMPELLLKSRFGSLCYESLRFCTHCQIARGKNKNVPFGISESAYYAFDSQLNYQYKAHGVQNLGIRRGLDKELVVSPYSTYLLMQMSFDNAYSNLEMLKKYGTYGQYGHYEAIDFTQSRSNSTVIKSYMAHHVGMSIVALSNTLLKGKMQERFMRDNYMESATELLEEKVISGSVIYDDVQENKPRDDSRTSGEEFIDYLSVVNPNVKLLANGDYTLAVTDLGATISIYQEKDVFARTTDLLRRPQGCYFAVSSMYGIQDFTYFPSYSDGELSAEFKEYCVNFYSNTNEFELGMKLFLHNSLPCEFREFAIKNRTMQNQKISLLSYFEPILINYLDFESHPAFVKLFLEIEIDKNTNTVIICRRDRNKDKKTYCAIGFTDGSEFSYNFDRENVLTFPYGTVSAFKNGIELPENPNFVPDPCVFMNLKLNLQPREQINKKLFICSAINRDMLYSSIAAIRNEKHTNVIASPVKPTSIEGQITAAILPQILYKKRDCYENDLAISKNSLYVRDLWALSISGDLPIVCIEILHQKEEQRVTGYIKSHQLLSLCGIHFDLVFVYSEITEQNTFISEMLKTMIRKNTSNDCIGRRGGIFLINSSKISEEQLNLIYASAVHIAPKGMVRIGTPATLFSPVEIQSVSPQKKRKSGFSIDKNKVSISQKTSVPWCHILANSVFGTMLSNNSLGFTYALNSRENKLTPWFNDTKTDNRGEMVILYARGRYYDLVLGSEAQFNDKSAVYLGQTELFKSKVTVTVSEKAMCKKINVELHWLSENCDVKICYYTEPVLGVSRNYTRLIIVEREDKCLLFKNPYNSDVKGFMALSSDKDFIGSTNREAILSGKWDENNFSSAHNLCGALIVSEKYKKNGTVKTDFYMSFGLKKESAVKMPEIFDTLKQVYPNSIRISTPDKNLDYMFNGWLPRQIQNGRLFARTGFYQCSGAFGFRDQLQDSCGMLLLNPDITKRQIFKACAAQFKEGDVLHWWHRLPNNIIRGVRTRYSDDLLWLPYTLCEYIEKTGDYSILKINIAYSEGELLNENEHEKYLTVSRSNVIESVYTHCKRAIERSMRFGDRGLVYMGCGDWNDGYNGVGIGGKGESVWLTQFFCIVLKKFAKLAEYVGESDVSISYLSTRDTLLMNIDKTSWDGEWYVRAFFDDGTPLGAKEREECRIDSLSQSFSEISEMPNKERIHQGLENAYLRLVDKEAEIIKLFEPPFSGRDRAVGYVSAYPMGIRENGGQYTHGAIWLAIAFLQNGQNDRGYELIKMLNPLEKYENPVIANRYKNEPYYMSADIYSNSQCYGRGGWSIYTGAASWYYRSIFEWLLGIKIDKTIRIEPKIPSGWNNLKAEICYKNTAITLEITRGNDCGLYDNGVLCEEILIDGKEHNVKCVLPN